MTFPTMLPVVPPCRVGAFLHRWSSLQCRYCSQRARSFQSHSVGRSHAADNPLKVKASLAIKDQVSIVNDISDDTPGRSTVTELERSSH